MDIYKNQDANCPNCWGHQQFADEQKASTEFSRIWLQKCKRTIGWIQHLLNQKILPQGGK